MIERILYFTGAGFSAPLGLPIMSDFYYKSRDMYDEHPDSYAHFQNIFNEIKEISVTKNYYSADLFNVEEFLSILEMRDQLEGSEFHSAFIRYLCDVITYYTPQIEPYGKISNNWHAFVFGNPNNVYRCYATFVANILNLIIEQDRNADNLGERFRAHCSNANGYHYAIVTVNYDIIIEQVVHFINTYYAKSECPSIDFVKLEAAVNDPWRSPALVKLHGGVDSETVVPPTWSKSVHKEIVTAWQAAYALLHDATQVRILGYSLPAADAYVRYLFKSSIASSPQLKAIDVICWDPDGTVRSRYEEFIVFRDLRFRSAKIEDYLNLIIEPIGITNDLPENKLVFDHLENSYARFMEQV